MTSTNNIEREKLIRGYKAHINSGYAKLAELMSLPIEVRSSGTKVYDETDQAYLSCGGFGVFILGHCHPRVISATKKQLQKHPLSTRTLLCGELVEAGEILTSVTPPGLEYVFFTNSGTEATELALKLAQLKGKRSLIAMQNGFHGKTLGSLSVMGKPLFRTPFEDWLMPAHFVPFGDVPALEEVLKKEADKACVILEPVQGEGGVIIPRKGFLSQVHDLCRQYGALLILDEIQTGMGRLGAWWGADLDGITPDILLVGKGLSGGIIPVGAVVATDDAFDPLNRDPLIHSSTFANNPLAMSAVKSTIETIQKENLIERARGLGQDILQRLRNIIQNNCAELVADVRGIGLLIAIEFKAAHLAGDFMMELLEQKVIISHSLNLNSVVRFTPSALLTESDCNWLYSAVHEATLALKASWA